MYLSSTVGTFAFFLSDDSLGELDVLDGFFLPNNGILLQWGYFDENDNNTTTIIMRDALTSPTKNPGSSNICYFDVDITCNPFFVFSTHFQQEIDFDLMR